MCGRVRSCVRVAVFAARRGVGRFGRDVRRCVGWFGCDVVWCAGGCFCSVRRVVGCFDDVLVGCMGSRFGTARVLRDEVCRRNIRWTRAFFLSRRVGACN